MCGVILTLAWCAVKGIPLYLKTGKSFQVQRCRVFVSHFFNNKTIQWNSKKYSIDNDYLWNTAVYFDFWELKSTMGGIGALTVFASNNTIEWVIKFPQTFLCPRHSKNGGGALSVTPVRAFVCSFVRLSVRPSVIKIWCPLNNFWKTASIQFKFGMLIYNIKT